MPSKTTLSVCLSDTLRESEREAFERMKAELTRAFAAPDHSYRPLSAAEIIARTRDRDAALPKS